MSELVRVNDREVPVIEYHGDRVVTLRMVDELHARPDGTAGRNFRKHRGKLLDGVDYWEVPIDEFRRLTLVDQTGGKDGILLSESGYLMLVKSFQDALAWEVQRALVSHYFRRKDLITPSEQRLMRMVGSEIATGIREGLDSGLKPLQQRLDGFEGRIGNMEDALRSVVRRQSPTSATKREHIDTLMLLGGKCPCCHKVDVIDEYGNRLDTTHWDHWYAPHRRAVHEVWLVCAECNQAMKDQRVRHYRQVQFDAYQSSRDEKHRPMFPLFAQKRRFS